MANENNRPAAGQSENEGEGNKTAARAYDRDTKAYVESGKVGPAASDAKRAVEGSEAEELKRAEEAGKSRSHGEDPALKR